MKNPLKASIRKAIILHHSEGMSYRDIVYQLRGFNVTKNIFRVNFINAVYIGGCDLSVLRKKVKATLNMCN